MIEARLSPEAEADKERLPTRMKYRLDDVLKRLESWPQVSGVKWLKHEWTGHARIRMGDWRVIFRIENDVLVVRIKHRSEAYEE
jgi:mRNA-degrading endonuclease RelE of RelBE toxin-antitoxin system